jgi:hypothetical protein
MRGAAGAFGRLPAAQGRRTTESNSIAMLGMLAMLAMLGVPGMPGMPGMRGR